MLSIKEVKYRNILKNINFTAKNGTVTGIIGKNGSGKTTLLKVVGGYFNYEGNVKYHDREIKKINLKERTRLINYLPQEFPEIELSVKEFLSLFTKNKESLEKVIRNYDLFNISNLPVSQISGGEKVRVFLGRIELIDPEILLFDEPSAFLDFSVMKLFENFIVKMKRRNKIILIVSNDLNFTINISDQLIGIKEGKSVKLQKIDEEELETLFNTNVKIVKIGDKVFVY